MHFILDIPLLVPAYNALFFAVFSTFLEEKGEKNGEKYENLIDSTIKESKKHIKNKKKVEKFEKQKKIILDGNQTRDLSLKRASKAFYKLFSTFLCFFNDFSTLLTLFFSLFDDFFFFFGKTF